MMPTETQPTTVRLTDAQRSVLDRLGVVWGPVAPLSRNQVVAELIRRAEKDLLNKKEQRAAQVPGDPGGDPAMLAR